jgi:hypothetical protein
MFVEIPLIQRCTHYLGHPSRATTVVLGTMLLGAGIGSMFAARVSAARIRKLAYVLPALVAVLAVVLPSVASSTLGLPLVVRGGVVVLTIAPVALAMGFAFPLGMVQFGEANRGWFWAVNGAVSVLASVSTLALSMAYGFTRVLWVGVVCYGIATLIVLREGAATAESR